MKLFEAWMSEIKKDVKSFWKWKRKRTTKHSPCYCSKRWCFQFASTVYTSNTLLSISREPYQLHVCIYILVDIICARSQNVRLIVALYHFLDEKFWRIIQNNPFSGSNTRSLGIKGLMERILYFYIHLDIGLEFFITNERSMPSFRTIGNP